MVPNHQPVIKVEFPMIFHKTIGLPYDKPFGFWQNMPPSWTSSPHLWRACRVTCYRATIFCTATNSVTVYPGWWLSLPLWKMMDWKSVGMMTFPCIWKVIIHKNVAVTTNQYLTNSNIHLDWSWVKTYFNYKVKLTPIATTGVVARYHSLDAVASWAAP